MLSKRTELRKLEEKLEEERNFNSWAWSKYGSELCSIEMRRREEDIEKKIHILSKELGSKCICHDCILKRLDNISERAKENPSRRD